MIFISLQVDHFIWNSGPFKLELEDHYAGIFQIVSLLGFVGIIWAIVSALSGHTVAGWASIICIVCFLGGVQLLSIGIIGEYVGKTYMESKHRPRYIISDRTWNEEMTGKDDETAD
jgi:hypothetical protein